MKSRWPGASGNYTAKSKWLSFALAALLCAPHATAAPRAPSPAPPQAGFLFSVNTTGDAARASSGAVCDVDLGVAGEQCTLRAAIEAANANAGADTIQVAIPASDPGCDPATERCTINLGTTLPELSTDMVISGPGADKLTVRRDSDELFRVFTVTTAGEATLSGMTISNGFANGSLSGGGVQNMTGTLTITNCAITDNVSTMDGGGIDNRGDTTNVINTLVARNSARAAASMCCDSAYGGGISNSNSGSLNVTNSTITGNSAVGAPSYHNHDPNGPIILGPGNGHGGGVSNGPGVTNITNSTISGNSASADPNGNNGVGQGHGGGVYNQNGAINLKSTIVANNTATTSAQDFSGSLFSYGYNLIEDATGASFAQQPTDRLGEDPKLGPLQNNGGPTQTMALLAGSPAIDKGTSDGLTGPLSTDQRGAGFARTVNNPLIQNTTGGDGTDMGAFELQPLVRFSTAAYIVGEGSASITITVKLTSAPDDEATVKYKTGNGTAVAGTDYTSESGTLTFAAGETAKTFTVPIIDDTLDEADETLSLKLSSPTGGIALGTPSTAVLKIVDDDAPPKLAINNATAAEGDSGALNAAFTVTLSAASAKTVTVKYATANGTARTPGDYAAEAGTVTFLPGQTTKTLTIGVRGDVLDEADETFFVNLSAAVNATFADAQGLCTITDDDPLPSLRINDVSVTEIDANTSNAALTLTLSAASGRTVTVNYATANGTASSSSDYVSKTGTVTFTAGQKTRTIVVQVRGDTLTEANETFFVNLSAAVNATIADAQGRVTILNDD